MLRDSGFRWHVQVHIIYGVDDFSAWTSACLVCARAGCVYLACVSTRLQIWENNHLKRVQQLDKLDSEATNSGCCAECKLQRPLHQLGPCKLASVHAAMGYVLRSDSLGELH